MFVVLKDDLDALLLEQLQIQIFRSILPRKIDIAVQLVTDIGQPLRASFLCPQLRGNDEFLIFYAQGVCQIMDQMNVDLGQTLPFLRICFFKKIDMILEKRSLGVVGDQRIQMFSAPLNRVVDLNLKDFLSEAVNHGYRQPLPAIRSLDFIPVLPFVLFKLNIVQEDEDIALFDLIKISQPGQVLRLMDGDDHSEAALINGLFDVQNWGLGQIDPFRIIRRFTF